MLNDANLPDPNKFSTWDHLVRETKYMLQGAADHIPNTAQCSMNSERHHQRAQSECFPEECNALKTHTPPVWSEYDNLDLIRVGGRL